MPKFTKPNTIIATWIHLDPPEEESIFPQVGGSSSSQKFQEIYWRCVAVFFETSLRFNENARHILFTNSDQIPIINKLDIKKYLKKSRIEIIKIDNDYHVPRGYYHSFNNQFFIFSILKKLHHILDEDDQVMLLDADCVFTKNVDDIFDKLQKSNGALTYNIEYNKDYMINGINRLQLQGIFRDLEVYLTTPPKYCAGEILCAKRSFIDKIVDDFPRIWRDQLQRFKNNKIKLNEEAQTLTFFYYKFGVKIGGLNTFIKRCWTNPYIYRNVKQTDVNFSILHLPDEKRVGLKFLFFLLARGANLRSWNNFFYRILIRIMLAQTKYHPYPILKRLDRSRQQKAERMIPNGPTTKPSQKKCKPASLI